MVVVLDGVGLEGEATVFSDLVRGAEVDDGAQTEGLELEDVGFGDPVDAVGPVQRVPPGGAAVGRGVSAQVTEVEGSLELDVANRPGRCSRHAFDGIDAT